MSTPQIVPSDGTPAAVSTSVAALPGARPGWHSLNPYLALHDAEGAIEWYKKALDATEMSVTSIIQRTAPRLRLLAIHA